MKLIHFDEYGTRENPTILLLHGAAALDTFCGQYCLATKYHLIVPHLYGAGRSADKVYEPELIKKDLFRLIDSLGKDKIGLIGHSLGGQLAVMLVCEHPEKFSFAVFLSAWVNPKPKIVAMYCRFAGMTAKMLHCKWLVRLQGKYWHYTKAQAHTMAEYSMRITPQVYQSFFANTSDLSTLPSYQTVYVPMFALCGSREVKDMKTSLSLLATNPNCHTMLLQKAGHAFPMTNSEKLTTILEHILASHACN